MWFRTILLSTLLITAGLTKSSAKSYEIPEIRIEVSINEDGTVLITEQLTYNFDGSFSWAQYRLPKQGFTRIKDIRISENGASYLNKNNEEQGTFSVSESNEYIQIKWNFNAEDEQRTFTISYTLEGALTIGPKWSQFFWNYLSDDREKATEQLDILINFPEEVSPDSLHVWTRRPLGRMNLQKEQGQFTISGRNIDDNDFAKVRTLFPTSIFDSPKITNPDFTLNQVRSEEETYDQKNSRTQGMDTILG